MVKRPIAWAWLIAGICCGCGFSGCAAEQRATGPVASTGSMGAILFNDGWSFLRDDVSGAAQVGFNDASWRKLDLPHDWSIEGPYDPANASATAFLPAGIAWYRKHFTLPSAANGKDVTLRFDGIYKHSTVYLNGKEVGGRPYGYSSFDVDLTAALVPGENVLAVRVDHHDNADSRWYSGSGIYRNVYLIASNPIHIKRYGVYVTTPEISAQNATVDLETSVVNDPAEGFTLRNKIYDPHGELVGTVAGEISTAGALKGAVRYPQTIQVPNPVLWSVDQPNLYTIDTEIVQGSTVMDSYRTSFGIRTAKFDPDTGFTLNGQPLKLKGVCIHEDAGALGSAVPQQVWERRLRILKEAGTNAIRTSHNPPDPAFLDLCDRLGFLVMDEAFDEWSKPKKKWEDMWNGKKFGLDGYFSDFAQWSDRDLEDMILRDRNHPSIIMWSVGNEIDYPNDPYPLNSQEPVDIAKRLIADVKLLDTTRPVTGACAAIASNLYYPLMDIVGYNYQESRYAEDHAKFPKMVIYGSENSQTLDAWLAVEKNAYISGQFLWTGIDYMGEAKAYPNHASVDGFVDLAGFPKPLYYFRQSLWSEKLVVHLEPTDKGLVCNTNCATVEFFQGGRSLGEKPLPADTRIIEAPGDSGGGPIRAVGKKNGVAMVETTYTPAGAAAKIALREYKTTLGSGGGPNIAQVELSITDRGGNLARGAADDVAITVSGPGRLIAMESGDNNSSEDPHLNHRKAHLGRMIVYVETYGDVTVTANAPGLESGSVRVGG